MDNSNSTSSTPSTQPNEPIFSTQADWIKHILASNQHFAPPKNPTYWWKKEDIYWPEMPDSLHVKLIKMRFKSRSGVADSFYIQWGEGLVVKFKERTEPAIVFPMEIQVRRELRRSIQLVESGK